MDTATVYFLGAGASKDAGIPVTAGLLPRVKANIRDRSDRDDLRRFVQTFDTGGSGQSGRAPIVELISFLDNAIRTERPLDTFFKLDRLRDVRRQLTSEVAKAVVSRKGARVEVPEDALDTPGATTLRVASYYRTFVQKLVGRDRTLVSEADLPLGDTVVTTNYDISIDVALYEAAYSEERRGGSSSVTDVYLGSEFRDPYDDTPAFSEPKMCVDLFKLHGSLNWLYCPNCSRIFVAAFGQSVIYFDTPESDLDELTCFCGYFSLEPVIVAPSAVQDISNPHLQAIWTNAQWALEAADHWVFSGYSLPPDDMAIRAMLHRAQVSEKRSKRPKVTVVAPSSDEKEWRLLKARYRALLGLGVRYLSKTFKDYIATA